MKRIKKLGKRGFISLALFIAAVVTVTAAVLYYEWHYEAEQAGVITISGATGTEGTIVLLDGGQIFNSGNTMDMDVATLEPGDDLTYSHTLESTNFYYTATVDFDLPVDLYDQGSDFYGISVKVNDGVNPDADSLSWQLEPGVQTTWYVHYLMDSNFIDPLIPFPFDMNVEVTNNPETIPDFTLDVEDDGNYVEYFPVWSDIDGKPYVEGGLEITDIDLSGFSGNDATTKFSIHHPTEPTEQWGIKCRVEPGDICEVNGDTVDITFEGDMGSIVATCTINVI